jgi:predicted phosphodiesterase
MRIAIISDIHANVPALKATLKNLENENIDKTVCLGDVVGYGGEPNPCCEMVREIAEFTVLGNHDAAVSERMDYSYYYDAAREALDRHKEIITKENFEWLKSLNYIERMEEHGLGFCHGSPINLQEFEYVFHEDHAKQLTGMYDELDTVTFIGHSHLTKCFFITPDTAEEVQGPEFKIEPDRKYIITAGSVGQPRDYDNRSCCGVFDTETQTFKYVRSEYDIEATASIIKSENLAPSFGRRLFFGI